MVKTAVYAEGDSVTRHMRKNFQALASEPLTSCGLPAGEIANDGRNISSEEQLDCETCREAWRRVRMLR